MHHAASPLIIAVILAAAGCGRSTYPMASLAGAVSIDGEPVLTGGLTFTPLRGGAGTGVYAPIDSGHYRADRVPRGPVRVFVMAVRKTGKTVATSGTTIPEVVSLLPSRYDAGIDIEVTADDLQRDFDLRSTTP